MSAAPQKLSVTNLQAGYGDVQVLWDISLEVGAGELVCIIGSNGAGKTTLMRCLSGLLQPSAGSIVIDGKAMRHAQPADFVNAGITHVPEGRRLFSAMSVRDNLLMGAYLRTDKHAIAADLERRSLVTKSEVEPQILGKPAARIDVSLAAKLRHGRVVDRKIDPLFPAHVVEQEEL